MSQETEPSTTRLSGMSAEEKMTYLINHFPDQMASVASQGLLLRLLGHTNSSFASHSDGFSKLNSYLENQR